MRITGCHGGEKVGGRPENLAGFRLQTTAGRSWGNTAALVTCPAVGLAEFCGVRSYCSRPASDLKGHLTVTKPPSFLSTRYSKTLTKNHKCRSNTKVIRNPHLSPWLNLCLQANSQPCYTGATTHSCWP